MHHEDTVKKITSRARDNTPKDEDRYNSDEIGLTVPSQASGSRIPQTDDKRPGNDIIYDVERPHPGLPYRDVPKDLSDNIRNLFVKPQEHTVETQRRHYGVDPQSQSEIKPLKGPKGPPRFEQRFQNEYLETYDGATVGRSPGLP